MDDIEKRARIHILEDNIKHVEMTISNLQRINKDFYDKAIAGCEENIAKWKKEIEQLKK